MPATTSTTVTSGNMGRGRFRRRGRRFKRRAKVAKPIREYVKKKLLTETELKYLTFANAGGTGAPLRPSTTFDNDTLNELQQGTASFNRVGDKIRVRRIQVWFKMDAVTDASLIRIMLVKDLKPNGANPTNALLFEDANLATVNPVHALYNQDNLNTRFKFIRDQTYQVNVYGGATDRVEKKVVKWDIHIPTSKPTIYTGNAGTIADILENAYHLIWYSDWPAAAGSRPNLFYYCILHYEDL